MDNALVTAPTGAAVARSVRLRISSVVVGLALIFAALVVVQHRAEASPAPVVAAAVAGAPAGTSVHGQFDVRGFVCAILLQVRNAFARSPFFGIVSQVLNSLLAAFGCLPSGAVPPTGTGFGFGANVGVGFNF